VKKTDKNNEFGMKNYERILLMAVLAIFASGTFVSVTAQNYELPRTAKNNNAAEKQKERILKHTGYVCSFNTERLTPTWVAWSLTRERLKSVTKRTNYFDVDPQVERRYQVKHSDYSSSRYDRGHMCPAADNLYNHQAQVECFYMTNMCPQNHALNAGAWNDLEIQCRSWARDYGKIHICTGPIYDKKPPRTIGNRKSMRIAVPDRFYKVVLMKGKTTKAIGFIYPNGAANGEMRSYAVTVDRVEQITGLDFFYQLDDKTESAVEKVCNPSSWGI